MVFCGEDYEYEYIYESLVRELDSRAWSRKELFEHFQQQCIKIFKIGEADYGKNPKNLPADYLEDVSFLYDQQLKKTVDAKKDCASKYGPDKEYSELSEEERKTISKGNLKAVIREERGGNSCSEDVESMVENVYRNHVKGFFGVEYKAHLPKTEKYEILQLVKILYECKDEAKVDLAYLNRLSFFRFKQQLPSKYQQAINYIKYELSQRLSYNTLIKLEYFNSTLKNCMNVLGEGIVAYELNDRVVVPSRMEQMARNSVYTKINANLERIRAEQAGRIECVEIDLWWRAYLHFIGKGLDDAVLSLPMGENWVDIDSDIYQKVDKTIWESFSISCEVQIEDLAAFVKDTSKTIVGLLCCDKKRMKNLKERVEKSCDDYKMMANIYNFGMNRPVNEALNIREIYLLIYLYETCKNEKIDIPIRDGYRQIRDKNALKIKGLMGKLIESRADENRSFLEGKEEYAYSIYWLIHKMNMVMTCGNKSFDELERKTKGNMLEFLRSNIPFIYDKTSPFHSINEIANALWSES